MNIRLAGIAFCLLALSAPARDQKVERSALVHVTQTGPQAETIKKTLEKIKLPPGFKIRLYALVPGARHMAAGPQGKVIFVGTAEAKVYAVTALAGSGGPPKVTEFAPSIAMNLPNGVCFSKDGVLFVVEQNRVLSFPAAEATYDNPSIAARTVVAQGKLIPPEDESDNHNLRVCRVGPDGKLYIALGQPYNVPPHEKMPEFNEWGIGGIIRMYLDGTGREVFARGIRNSVGMDFNPKDGILWFTDNQVDGMGDDIPPEELNRAPKAGIDFGFPWYGGGHIRTEEYKNETPPEGLVFPEIETPAHAANLGMTFYTGTKLAKYRGGIFFAQHGSWNRSVPIGARVSFASLEPDGTGDKTKVFAEGWLNEKGTYDGRPVDVAQLPDGSLIASDDYAGALYRLTYEGAMPPK